MGLKKLDVLIRGNSTITQDDAVEWTKNWLNKRQEAKSNKNGDKYIEEFFAELFDSRDSTTWKVFSDYATDLRVIKNTYKCEDGREFEGVIETFNKTKLIKEVIDIVGKSDNSSSESDNSVEVRKIEITENPYVLDEDVKFVVANCDDDAAEVRVMGDTITVFDSDGFSDSETLLEVNTDRPLKLELLIIKE